MVVLEGDRAPVGDPVVGFHHDAPGTPKEVHFPAPELGVHLGPREVVLGADAEEERLQVRARAVRLDATEVVAHELRLALGAAVEPWWDVAL
jgi:hypothetical protein